MPNPTKAKWIRFGPCTKRKRGERFYDNMRYLKSTNVYAPIYQRNGLTEKGKGLLAQSYLNIAEYNSALQVLQSMDTLTMQPNDVYNMAQTLKLKGLYDESDEWMAKFKALKSDDSRPKWQSNSAAEIEKIINKERYAIECMWFNSPQSDFGAVALGNQVVFASARKVDEVMAREYGWNETPYLNVFKVVDSAQTSARPEIFSPKLKTVYHDGPVFFSTDGKEMYVTQNPYRFPGKIGKKQINHFQLLVSKKLANGTWGELELLPFNGKGFSTGHAALSANGQRLWFASDRPGGIGKSDIYYVVRNGDGWGEPVNAGAAINTEGDEMFPFEATDGKLYFSSNGHLTLGGLDVCIAFNTINGYKVRNMGHPINGTNDDFALSLSPDNKSGYFSSNRASNYGDDDIYRFDVLDPIVLNRMVEVTVLDEKTLKPIEGCEVSIGVGGKDINLKPDATGLVSLAVEDVDMVSASAKALGYQPRTSSLKINSDINKIELLLTQIPVWGVYGTVTDLSTGKGVDSIQVVIQPVGHPNLIGNMTLDGGTFRNELAPETDYVVTLNSPQFFTKKGSFTTKGRAPGWININEFMEPTIERIEMNKVIEIPNIYYDLGKWNIRKDAAVELDKVVAFMNDNPSIVIELGSHTDSRGSATSNQSLSQKRAQSAVDYIVNKGGIASSRISAKGYGESMLKNHCADGVTCPEAEHQQNRRTEIRVVGVK
jgi:outer membrane protein OmpA-like peptidoglycan-associated protein